MRPRVRRFGSICSGAFIVAAAGLLDGRRAVTHWARCDEFRAAFPKVKLEPDALHIRDGDIYTSAGVTAGMDLALAMVEEDRGHRVALDVARQLVLFLKRPGGQSQFSTHLTPEADGLSPVRAVQDWVRPNPGADLRVEALAERAGMSPRNFARVFLRETGTTPLKFVESTRIDAARRRLERTRDPVERIAADLGLRHGGDDAADLPAPARRDAAGLPHPFPRAVACPGIRRGRRCAGKYRRDAFRHEGRRRCGSCVRGATPCC